MVIITAYFRNEDNTSSQFEFAISDWYSKPSILCSLAFKLGCLFVTASDRGCRQFCPVSSNSFPVHNLVFLNYKENLPYVVIEFSNNSTLYSARLDEFMDTIIKSKKSI